MRCAHVLVINLFCKGGAERYVMCFKAEVRDRILCHARRKAVKRCWRYHSAYGTELMMRITVFRLWKHCKNGHKRLVDDAWCGKPSTAATDVNIDNIE